MHISLLLTCFNRREKTCSCLQSLYEALDKYNASHEEQIQVTAYMVDDGCTDGTADAVKALLPDCDINILQGDGNLFWAGGMRFAWREAMKRHQEWDYYLLVNDDVVMMDNVFDDLLETEKYALEKYGKESLSCGFTISFDQSKTSFGGSVKDKGLLNPTGEPQMVDYICANVLLVPKIIVNEIGIFDDDFIHGGADYDYGLRAKKSGFPVLTTQCYDGICDNEHYYDISSVLKLSLSERKQKLYQPPRGKKDYLTFLKKHRPFRWFFSCFVLLIQIYFPHMHILLFSNKVDRQNKIHNR